MSNCLTVSSWSICPPPSSRSFSVSLSNKRPLPQCVHRAQMVVVRIDTQLQYTRQFHPRTTSYIVYCIFIDFIYICLFLLDHCRLRRLFISTHSLLHFWLCWSHLIPVRYYIYWVCCVPCVAKHSADVRTSAFLYYIFPSYVRIVSNVFAYAPAIARGNNLCIASLNLHCSIIVHP